MKKLWLVDMHGVTKEGWGTSGPSFHVRSANEKAAKQAGRKRAAFYNKGGVSCWGEVYKECKVVGVSELNT